MNITKTVPGFVRIVLFCLGAQFLVGGSVAADRETNPERILLAGNSILYTNNVPEILSEIAKTNGKALSVDMFAKGGAQISDLLASKPVMDAIESEKYDVVVFHDRGGDAMCAASPPAEFGGACKMMIEDHIRFAGKVRSYNAKPYLLGTYQPSWVSARLASGERFIAAEAGIPHIEISEKWNALVAKHPDMPWLAEDGMHPGVALSVLMASEIYRSLFGTYPRAADIRVDAALDIPREHLRDVVSTEALPTVETTTIFSEEEFQKILGSSFSDAP